MAWMYILECADGSYYVGSTRNLEQRIFQHQQGLGAKYTSNRLPVKLVYGEEYDRVADAYAREKQVQGWRRASAFLARIETTSRQRYFCHLLVSIRPDVHGATQPTDNSKKD